MDREELKVTAHLARLELSGEETEKLEKAVLQMLDYFSKMRQMDVGDLLPTTRLLKDNRLREDVVHEQPPAVPEAILQNAPDREDRFIVIPNIF